MSPLEKRSNGAAVAIAEHQRRPDQIRTFARSARARSMAARTLGGIRDLSALGRHIVDAMPVRRAHMRSGSACAGLPRTAAGAGNDDRLPAEVLREIVEHGVELL